MVKDVTPGAGNSNPKKLRSVAGRLLYSYRGERKGMELWASDGAASGTELVRNINPGQRLRIRCRSPT